MPPVVDYARKQSRSWRDIRLLIRQILRRVSLLLLLTLIAAIAALSLIRDTRRVGTGSPDHYWKVLFNGWGNQVDCHGGEIIYVWRGRDHHLFLQLDESAARAAADAGVQDYVRTLIRYLHASDSSGNTYAATLRQLTGQDFRLDAHAWQAWADAHLADLKGGDAVYQQLIQMRSAQTASEYPLPPGTYNFRDPLVVETRWRQIYQDEIHGFWSRPMHLFEALLLLAYLVSVIVLLRRYIREPLARDYFPGLRD